MSTLITCPECTKHLQVPDDLLGKKVQCPECRHTFTASAPEEIVAPVKVAKVKEPTREKEKPPSIPETKKRKRRNRDDDDDDDRDNDDDVDIRRSRKGTRRGRGPDEKPGKLQAIGIMTLIGGILAILIGLGLLAGSGFGCCATAGPGIVLCFWPGTYYSLVLGILAIIRGSSLLGANAHLEKPPTGIAIMQIINIVNGDVVNLVLGILVLVFSGDEEVQEYLAR
jgi:predicted Zn finger-like uncharacterized protein